MVEAGQRRAARTPPGKLLRTSTFRLALLYLALFCLSVLALLGFIYWNTIGFVADQTDATVNAEITGLAEQYRRTGLAGLRAVVGERSRNQRFSLYLLTSPGPARVPIAGNLDAWPPVETGPGGWLDFVYDRPVGADIQAHQARARHQSLAGGFNLLVGRDDEERRRLELLIRESLLWAMALTLGLGLIGGVVISRNMLRRIDGIARASQEIMAGDFSRRVPVGGAGDEIDRLAGSLNAMLDEIERLMTGLREVTDNIAHDLRSPLNRLRNRLEVTLMREPSAPAYRDAIGEAVADAEGLLNTFNALLGIARADAGAPGENLEPLDPGALVRDVAELYAPAAEDKGLTLDHRIDDGLDDGLDGDRHLLSQALANLVDNAVKYTSAGGRILVAARRDGAAVELSVADSGPGIPAADRTRVLDRFVRLDASRHSPGSGLGLSLVRAVARRHGAELRLEDNAPGLRAVLRFPAAVER